MINNATLQLIPQKKQAVLEKMITALSQVAGVKAIVLGGSYARGTATAQSDVDLGVYYYEAEPLDIEAIRIITSKFTKSVEAVIVTQLYEWGPWVNGGAWIQTEIGKVDFLYRNIDQLERVIDKGEQGKIEWDFAQQPPYGFHSVIYFAETKHCLTFFDPEMLIRALKKRVLVYPLLLKTAIIKQYLWGAEFALLQADKFASIGDIYCVAGCITRIFAQLTQVLFALNEEYFINDKNALDVIEGFFLKPSRYKEKTSEILEKMGRTPQELTLSLSASTELFLEVRKLAADFYKPMYSLK